MKSERRIPKNNIDPKKLIDSKHPAKKNIEKSSHTVILKEIENHPNYWFYKINNTLETKKTADHKNGEYEAAASAVYRLIVGDRVPISQNVINAKGERLGVISEGIEGYQSFKQAEIQKKIFNRYAKAGFAKEELINGGIARIIVAAYVCDENDFHLGNIGFRKDKKIVKIDHNQSFRTLTIKYTDGEGQQVYMIPIHAKDIETLPVLTIAKPHRWVIEAMTSCLKTINQDKEFEHEKYTYFLKSILISPDALQKIANDNFTTEKGAKRFLKYFLNRLQEIEDALYKVSPFIQFLSENPDMGEKLINHFDPSEHEYIQEKTQKIYQSGFEIDSKNTAYNKKN